MFQGMTLLPEYQGFRFYKDESTMERALLEQGVILAAGWKRRAEYLSIRPRDLTVLDKPQGITLSDSEFLDLQSARSEEACQWWEKQVDEYLQYWTARLKVFEEKQSRLLNAVEKGRLTPARANQRAQKFSRQHEHARMQIQLCKDLAACLQGDHSLPLPVLPLCQYSVSNHTHSRNWMSASSALKKSQSSILSRITGRFVAGSLSFHSLSITDRTALVLSLLLSALIAAGGCMYAFRGEKIAITVKAIDRGEYEVSFSNTSPKTLALILPYNGGGLEKSIPPPLGVTVELLDKKKDLPLNQSIESLWYYRDKSAYLKGPVLLSPFSQEVLSLRLDRDEIEKTSASEQLQIRLTIFRAPNRKSKSFTFPLSSDAGHPKE